MKKFRKIMAVLVATIMVVAMTVPAWASTNSDEGRLDDVYVDAAHPGTATGSITIYNVKTDETYTVWRMFDLASFDDKDTAPGSSHHSTNPNQEAYSYVIDDQSPWYGWLLGHTDGNTENPVNGTVYAAFVPQNGGTSSVGTNQLFWIESVPVEVNGNNHYHVIYATSKFKNSADRPAEETAPSANSSDYLTDSDAAVVQKFAQEAVEWAQGDGSALLTGDWDEVFGPYKAPTNANIVVGAGATALNGGTDLRLGYYLLGTSQGTLCSLDTTNRDVSVYDKNQSPTLTDKWVLKKGTAFNKATLKTTAPTDEDTTWVQNRDARIGEKVYFRTKIVAMQGAENYVLHDVMEPGLVFDTAADQGKGTIELITLTRSGTTYEIENSVTVGDDTEDNWSLIYAGTGSGKTNDGCDFEIKFEPEVFYLKTKSGEDDVLTPLSILDNDVINVYYSATVSASPVFYNDGETADSEHLTKIVTKDGNDISDSEKVNVSPVSQVSTISNDDERNTNYTILTYGKNSFTPEFKTATVTVYRFDIVKTTSLNNLLGEAEFTLYQAATSGSGTSYSFAADGSAAAAGTTRYLGDAIYFTNNGTDTVYTYDIEGASGSGTTTLTASTAAEIMLKGLDAGEYLLLENKEPTGYNKLAYPIWITINGGDDDGSSPLTPAESTITIVTKDNNDHVSSATTKAWDANITTSSTSPTTGLKEYIVSGNGGLQVINYTSTELPSTGGMGTTVLYIVGGMLVILAGAYLFFSRKRTA